MSAREDRFRIAAAAVFAFGVSLAPGIIAQSPGPTPQIERLRTESQSPAARLQGPEAGAETSATGGKSGAFESTATFMDFLAGKVWEQIGCFGVRRVRFGGEGRQNLDYDNRLVSSFANTRLVDSWIGRVEFRDHTSSWYFFLPDGLHVLNCKAEPEWRTCEPFPYEKGTKPWHPDDMWRTTDGFDFPYLRLTDGTVELQKDLADRPTVVPAWEVTGALTEFSLPDGRLFWAAESSDATQLWLIQVRHVFGARLCEGPRVTVIPPDAPPFLEEREKRMGDFIDRLHSMKLHTEALALERELVRRMVERHGPGSFEQRAILDIYPQARPR